MQKLCYRIELGPGLQPFAPEIDHALRYVERYYPVTREGTPEKTLRYGGEGADVPASLFAGGVRLDEDGIHLERARFDGIERFWPVGAAVAGDAFSYDAIGLIFLMLSRLEERDATTLDRHGRFESSADTAIRRGFRERAVADEAAEALAAWLLGGPPPKPGKAEILLTHDVDRLKRYHRWHEPLRYAAGDLIKRQDVSGAFGRFSAYLGNEPWDSFRDLMDVSERHGLTSHFYFMGPSDHPMDSPYVQNMAGLLRNVTDDVQRRGHRIGFHPGYATLHDPAEFQRQKSALEEIAGSPVTEGRQHVLRYDCASTPAQWDRAGMTDDYTLAYADDIGFRNGACRAHNAYDLKARKALSLNQTATCVAEFSLFDARYQDIAVEQALEKSLRLFKVVQAFGGRYVILYHTGQPVGKARDFYEQLLHKVS